MGYRMPGNFPIHNEFLDKYLFWTSDKTVLSNRPKQLHKVTKSGSKKCVKLAEDVDHYKKQAERRGERVV